MKKHKTLIIVLGIIAFLIILSISGRFLNKNESGMIFFYGNSCPHCKEVEEYIATNNIKAKLNFKELETWENQSNAALLASKAKQCGVDISQGVPVPLFFDGQNCYVGSDKIKEFFASK